MDFLILIKNGCDNVTATAAPSLDSLGLHMVIALATIMLVWFGVQEALASAQGGPGFNIAKFISFFVLITFAYCLVAVIIAYGAIGATIIGLLGPVFIPWMVFDKTDFLFWGWLKAFIGFEFYKVVAAATMSVVGHLLITYLTSGAMNINDPTRLIYLMPGLLMMCIIAGFILLKIPTMTATLFSGHTGGHSSGMGSVITALILRAL